MDSFLNRLKAILFFVGRERKRAFGGFTLIELVVIIAIVGILSGIGIPTYGNYIDKAKVVRTIAELRTLEREILLYKDSENALPESLGDIGRGNLMDPWGNPYQYLGFGGAKMKGKDEDKETGKDKDGSEDSGKGKMRKDRFLVPINSDFDLYSMGKDGRSVAPLTAKASHDDIVRANDGQYMGIASGY